MGIRIFAHRGSTEGGAVENTIEAFRYALDSGANYLESDVQATKDGVAVLFHDSNLKRISGINARVSDFTFKELSAISLGRNQVIPRLVDALERFPNARWNLDLKTKNSIHPAIQAIEKAGAQDRVLVSSFSRSRRLAALRALNGVATSTDASTIFAVWVLHKLRLRSQMRKMLIGVDAIQIPKHFGFIRLDTKGFISTILEAGVEIHFWTINDFDDAKRLVDLGAQGIVTDQSKMMVERFRTSKSK